MNEVHPQEWPSGRSWPICSIAMTAAEIAERFGIRFSRELDDLGEVLEAAVWEPSVNQILLTWRDHPAIRSTQVEVDSMVTRDEGLAALWRLTHLDVRDFDWVNVYARFPQPQTAAGEVEATLLPRQITGLGELTEREIQVLDRAANGQTNREIGRELEITPSTVATYLQRVYLKLGLSGRRELKSLAHHNPTAA